MRREHPRCDHANAEDVTHRAGAQALLSRIVFDVYGRFMNVQWLE